MRKSLLFIVLGSLVVLALTFASYLVLTKFRPEDEVRRMFIAMSRLHTVNQSGGFGWTSVKDNLGVHTTLYTSGQLNLEDLSRLEQDIQFRSVFLGGSNQYADLSGELKTVGDKTYLTYAAPGPEVKGVSFAQDGTWVSFAQGEFPFWGSVVPGMVLPLPTSKDSINWSPESVKQVRTLIALADIFHVTFSGSKELIRNQETRIIDARFDPDATNSFLLDLLRARDIREPTDEDRLLADAQTAALVPLSVRMWIGSRDHLLYRLEIHGNSSVSDQNKPTPVDVRVEFSDFNKPYTATAPTSLVSFSSILKSVLQSLPTSKQSNLFSQHPVLTEGVSLPAQFIETADDPDHDGLNNTLEVFFGTNPNNPDTDGDGVNDGDEVRRGTNPRGKGSLFGFGLGR